MAEVYPSTAGNLTKRDIVLSIFDKKGDVPQKDVREVVQMTLDTIAQALARGRNVELRNFGVFEVQIRKSRVGRNPNKPEEDVPIPERAVIKFKAGKELKAELKQLKLPAREAPAKAAKPKNAAAATPAAAGAAPAKPRAKRAPKAPAE